MSLLPTCSFAFSLMSTRCHLPTTRTWSRRRRPRREEGRPRDVEALERRLPLLGPVQNLVLDLSGARDLDDAIVARLVEVLRCSAASVELRGLSLHQRRLLRYLGHPVAGDISPAQLG